VSPIAEPLGTEPNDWPSVDLTGPITGLMRPVVWCEPGDSIREVARRIDDSAGTCALVRCEAGLGIVTDHDFRHRVATGEIGVDAPVTDLVTMPALTIDEYASPATGLLRMVEHGVHHLVVTSPSGAAIGVLRVADVAQVEARDPFMVRAAIEAADTLDALADACAALPDTIMRLHEHQVPPRQVGAAHSAIVEAVLQRVLALRPSPVLAGVSHSWILLGSLARREPLLLSDVDTALLWADPPAPEPDLADSFRSAAGEILQDLRRCGLRPCPDGANADNPLFSRSQADWSTAARGWMHDPDQEGALLLSAMVADSRPVTNVVLGDHLTDSIRSHTRTRQFLRALLDQALGWRPPTGFLRDFVVHHTGEHRGQLDLKRGGLAPIVALARWIAIATGDTHGTTPDRLRRGADGGLLTGAEADTLVSGFDHVYALLLDHEVRATRAGTRPTTYLSPGELNPLTRRHLRETFRAIAAVQTRADQEFLWRLTR